MSRFRASILGLAAVALGFASGCRSTSNCGCEPPREGLLARLGLRTSRNGNGNGNGNGHGCPDCCGCSHAGPVIGTTVSSAPITGGGFYSSPVYSGPVSPGPIVAGPIPSGPVPGSTFPEGYGSPPVDGPNLPPLGTTPPGALPYPGIVPGLPPTDGGGFAKPTEAAPAGRYKY